MRPCQRACKGEDAASCTWVAHALLVPAGPHHDPGRAHALLARACEDRFFRACADLGLSIADTDPKRSAQLLSRGCEAGYGRACVTYVGRHLLSAPPFDWPAAAPWLQRGCAADDALACVAVGDLLRTGQGLAADPQAARESYHRACELGRKSACDEEAESASGEPRLHAIYAPDPPIDRLVALAEADANVRVRVCVGPSGDVEVGRVGGASGSVATLVRGIVESWRFTPTGATGPRCREIVFGIQVE